jgi:hypothetical protein
MPFSSSLVETASLAYGVPVRGEKIGCSSASVSFDDQMKLFYRDLRSSTG